jgi:hypothetical protein
MVPEHFSCSSNIILAAKQPITGFCDVGKCFVKAISLVRRGAKVESVTENVKPVRKSHVFNALIVVISGAGTLRIGTDHCEWLIVVWVQGGEHLIEILHSP